ncbi:hypothetical protein E4A41_10545, partial [Micrococcus endophyticus]
MSGGAAARDAARPMGVQCRIPPRYIAARGVTRDRHTEHTEHKESPMKTRRLTLAAVGILASAGLITGCSTADDAGPSASPSSGQS